MCRIACADGIQVSAALAHQNERWSAVNPQLIRERVQKLTQTLHQEGIALSVFPCSEVMARPDLEAAWQRRELLSVADRGSYLLVEMPNDLFVDLRQIAGNLRQSGVRLILAHPERTPELLHDLGRIEQLIQVGCLIQVSSGSVTNPSTGHDLRALKSWFRRGVVHLMGSDAHSPRRRRPRMAEAYRKVLHWVGIEAADRVFSTNAAAVVYGMPLQAPLPEPPSRRWFVPFW
jgi:protein-tyrosine phosphatase